jgi:hypothetical protein
MIGHESRSCSASRAGQGSSQLRTGVPRGEVVGVKVSARLANVGSRDDRAGTRLVLWKAQPWVKSNDYSPQRLVPSRRALLGIACLGGAAVDSPMTVYAAYAIRQVLLVAS